MVWSLPSYLGMVSLHPFVEQLRQWLVQASKMMVYSSLFPPPFFGGLNAVPLALLGRGVPLCPPLPRVTIPASFLSLA